MALFVKKFRWEFSRAQGRVYHGQQIKQQAIVAMEINWHNRHLRFSNDLAYNRVPKLICNLLFIYLKGRNLAGWENANRRTVGQ